MKDKHFYVEELHRKLQETAPALASAITQRDLAILVSEGIDCLKEIIIKGEPIRFHKFGIFELYASKRRKGRNPQTGEAITIPPRKKVKFRTSKTFADDVINL